VRWCIFSLLGNGNDLLHTLQVCLSPRRGWCSFKLPCSKKKVYILNGGCKGI